MSATTGSAGARARSRSAFSTNSPNFRTYANLKASTDLNDTRAPLDPTVLATLAAFVNSLRVSERLRGLLPSATPPKELPLDLAGWEKKLTMLSKKFTHLDESRGGDGAYAAREGYASREGSRGGPRCCWCVLAAGVCFLYGLWLFLRGSH